MERILKAWIVALACAFGPGAAVAGEYLTFYGFTDLRSAYQSRGVIINKDPFVATYARGGVKLGPFGYVRGWIWGVSALTSTGQSAKRRYAFHENDLAIDYGYPLQIAEGWTLDSYVSPKWVTLHGYRGDPDTIKEWNARQELRNPYVTPYYLLRLATAPRHWTFWDVGAYHRFPLADSWSLTPTVFFELGDGHHLRGQYGLKNRNPALQTVNLMMRLNYAFTKWCGIYAHVHEFVVVDPGARHALRRSTTKQSVTDLTIFSTGVYLSF